MDNQNQVQNQGQKGGKGTASLVLGIISIVFIFFNIYAFIGLILAIIGLILGIQAKKINPNDGQAKAGVVLCIIGIVLTSITFLACTICVGLLAGIGASL